jgi:hypothetical protein
LDEERQNIAVDLEFISIKYNGLTVYSPEIQSIIDQQQVKLAQLQSNLRDNGYDLREIREELRVCSEIQAYCIEQNNRYLNEPPGQHHEPISSSNGAGVMGHQYERELYTTRDVNTNGSLLTAIDFQNVAMRERNSGKSVDTDRAAQTEAIRSCFNIRRNSIAQSGALILRMAIVGPDGEVLTGKNSGTTSINGTQLQYSESCEVEYQRTEAEVCVSYTANEGYQYKKGNYKIYIYEGGNMIGSSSIMLK